MSAPTLSSTMPEQMQPAVAAPQIRVDESHLTAMYANFCRVTGTPEELIIDVDLFLVYGDEEVSSLPLCRTFVRRGRQWVDCAPALDRRFAAPLPDDVLISRNEDCLAIGRYGVFVPLWSRLGRLMADLVDLDNRKPLTEN